MEWISIDVATPNVEELGGQMILILVNGHPQLCEVIGNYFAYITLSIFTYTKREGWGGDIRFAKPTHWMPIPKLPGK